MLIYYLIFACVVFRLGYRAVKREQLALFLFNLSFFILAIGDAISYYVIDWRPGFSKEIEVLVLIFYLVSFSIVQSMSNTNITNTFYLARQNRLTIVELMSGYLVVFLLLYVLPANTVTMFLGYWPKTLLLVGLFRIIRYHNSFSVFQVVRLLPFLLIISETSRRFYILIFIGLFAAYYLKKGKTIGLGKIIRGALPLAFVGFIFLNALRANHDYGEGFNQNSPVENTLTYIVELKSLDTYWNTMFCFDYYSENDRLWGSTYLAGVSTLIPRSFWHTKPYSFASILGYNVRTGRSDFTEEGWRKINMFSLSPGLLGELYANFGFAGIIFGSVFIGYLVALLNTMFSNSRGDVIAVVLLSFVVLIVRGDFFSAFNFSIYCLPWLILRVLR